MTRSDIDNGRSMCLVGVAPPRPVKFVLLRIGQKREPKGCWVFLRAVVIEQPQRAAPRCRIPPRRRLNMFARMTTLQGSPAKVADGIKSVQEQIIPAAQKMRGFKGMIALADRSSGKMLGIFGKAKMRCGRAPKPPISSEARLRHQAAQLSSAWSSSRSSQIPSRPASGEFRRVKAGTNTGLFPSRDVPILSV